LRNRIPDHPGEATPVLLGDPRQGGHADRQSFDRVSWNRVVGVLDIFHQQHYAPLPWTVQAESTSDVFGLVTEIFLDYHAVINLEEIAKNVSAKMVEVVL
jgi:hypothetical protein